MLFKKYYLKISPINDHSFGIGSEYKLKPTSPFFPLKVPTFQKSFLIHIIRVNVIKKYFLIVLSVAGLDVDICICIMIMVKICILLLKYEIRMNL